MLKKDFRKMFLVLLFLTISIPTPVSAGCEHILEKAHRKEAVEYARYIHKSNPEFYKSAEVIHEQERLKKISSKVSSQPQEIIADWLEAIQMTHAKAVLNEQLKLRLEKFYFDKYIIKFHEIPESYYESQKKLAREQGHGNLEITEQYKKDLAHVLIQDQKASLKKWLDYLLSSDAESYPFWKKYWAFVSLLKMGTFDIEKAQFQKRSKSQVALFPELNREALAKVFDHTGKKSKIEDYNFSKEYAKEFNEIRLEELNLHQELTRVDGIWVRYKQGSDEKALVKSLENKGTGWCTAGLETARAQLKEGDFHIFYSYDKNGQPTVPRVAIRFQGDKIVEVRGRDKAQNIDPSIAGSNIVDTKLKEFGQKGARYQKASFDMRQLSLIEKKAEEKTELTKQDLRFLYEVDQVIEGFGYEKDPRVQEIILKRDIRKDLTLALDVDPHQISLTWEEALSGNMVFHYGDIELGFKTELGPIVLPKHISGNLRLSELSSLDAVVLPEHVGGYVDLQSVRYAKDVKFPRYIGGGLNLMHLKGTENVTFPEYVGKYLNLSYLTHADGLVLPEHVGGDVAIADLAEARGLKFPQYIGGYLNLSSLESVEGIQFPECIEGTLNFPNLEKVEELTLPQYIGGNLNFGALESAKKIVFPQSIGKSLQLKKIISLIGITFPQHIEEDLLLDRVSLIKETVFPDHIGKDLKLSTLFSADSVALPVHIGGALDISNLHEFKNLTLPRNIGKVLKISNLEKVEGLEFPEFIGTMVYVKDLSVARQIELPEDFKGEVVYISSEGERVVVDPVELKRKRK